MNRCYALLSVLCVLVGCLGNTQDHEVIHVMRWHDSAKTKVKAEYYVLKENPSVLHGLYKEYNANGQLIIMESDSLGKLHGKFTTYYDNGHVMEEGQAVFGQYHGVVREYHSNGQPALVRKFHNDRLVSILGAYDSSGNALDVSEFKDGHGFVNDYNPGGKVVRRGPYVDGLRHGVWQLFFSDASDTGAHTFRYEYGYLLGDDGRRIMRIR